MAEPKADPSFIVSSGFNVHEGVREGKRQQHRHHEETHGLRDDIDEGTPINDVKAPNVFERAKEEIDAIVQAIHQKKEADTETSGESRNYARKEEFESESQDLHSEKNSKSPNLIEKAKEGIEALVHKKKPAHHHHRKETHGTSDDIDENTPVNKIRGPNVFERAKEEIEAIFETIHPKKDSGNAISSPKEGGFKMSVGRGLEKIFSPGSHNRD